jgi:hypothetical protein
MAIDPAKSPLLSPDGDWNSFRFSIDLDSETAAALQRRADVKLARLFVRAPTKMNASSQLIIIPRVNGGLRGDTSLGQDSSPGINKQNAGLYQHREIRDEGSIHVAGRR